MSNHAVKIVMLGPASHVHEGRRLLSALNERGHDVLWLQRNTPSLTEDGAVRRALYADVGDLRERYRDDVADADAVIVCSGLAELRDIGQWAAGTARGVSLLYDTDAAATLAALENGGQAVRGIVPLFDAYLSSSGGAALDIMRSRYGARNPKALYPAPDSRLYYPRESEKIWDLGYLGDYGADAGNALQHMLIDPANQWLAGRFVVAGSGYPASLAWTANVERKERLDPHEQASFYCSQRFALTCAGAYPARVGHSPPARLFEIAACGTPIISDYWKGLETFFDLGKDILIASSKEHVLHYLKKLHEEERIAIGQRARARVMARHTTAHRARELEGFIVELLKTRSVLCAVP